jgi:hypothetical protein
MKKRQAKKNSKKWMSKRYKKATKFQRHAWDLLKPLVFADPPSIEWSGFKIIEL